MSDSGIVSGNRDSKQDWIPGAVMRSLYHHCTGLDLVKLVDEHVLLYIDEHIDDSPDGSPCGGQTVPDLYYALQRVQRET